MFCGNVFLSAVPFGIALPTSDPSNCCHFPIRIVATLVQSCFFCEFFGGVTIHDFDVVRSDELMTLMEVFINKNVTAKIVFNFCLWEN